LNRDTLDTVRHQAPKLFTRDQSYVQYDSSKASIFRDCVHL